MRIFMRWVPVIVWMGVIYTLSAIPSLASPLAPEYDFILRKCAHMAEYAVVTILAARALRLHLTSPMLVYPLAILVAGAYALSDEWHQTFVIGREGTLRDVGIDLLGSIGVWALTYTWWVTTAYRRRLADRASSR